MNAYSLHNRSTVIVSVSSEARSRSDRRMRSTSSSVLSLDGIATAGSMDGAGLAASGPKIAADTEPKAAAIRRWYSGRGRCLPRSQFFHMRRRCDGSGSSRSACILRASVVCCWVHPRARRSAVRRCAQAGRLSCGIVPPSAPA
jgi:hypothetical protein